MDATARLTVVAWIWLLAGAYCALELVVSWFLPVEDPVIVLNVLSGDVNLAIVTLPIGIGLLKRNDTARKVALVFSWIPIVFAVVGAAIVLLTLIFGETTFSWETDPSMADGDALARALGSLLIGFPLFFWQFRVLRSPGSRQLTTGGGQTEDPALPASG